MRISAAPRIQLAKTSPLIPTEALDRLLKMSVAMRIGQAHRANDVQVLSSSYGSPDADKSGTFSATVQSPDGQVLNVKGRYELGESPRVYVTDLGGLGPA